ncbi:GntR family transcriptional regulator [Cellulomonas carbonis]|uniref:GntR family transcriptional regulator n=1 Tax=Cellulomonas carbonis T26 TaxID=947969 RepID=A0A0A0BY03_9CELL|nr:GntR family transcriptional regulator [Cellulomonas carbonis]KGM12069.1 GntR family transcriptional regulator [Cellulomonas carbonis T26]GGC08215.1 GntR family transcriptional regulator [Cellulomonas carbonis]
MFDGRDPIYLQIADRIRGDVLSGALAGEEQVMSTTQYATTFRINPATAAKAFALLVDEGVLYKRRGIGMFVSPDAREHLLTARRERFFVEVVDPVAAEAAVLGVPVDAVVERLRSGYAARATAATTTTTAPHEEGDPR